jgi:hypothetical protein
VEFFRFDRHEKVIDRHGSVGLVATRVAETQGSAGISCLTVGPGGVIGTHPATGDQLFILIAGDGWVAGADGARVPISAGSGVRWDAGEVHTSGTEAGFTAIAVEGPSVALFDPEVTD